MDYEDETYAKKLDDVLVQNEKDIKKYLINPNESINEEIKAIVKLLTFLTIDNYSEVVGQLTNIMKYFSYGMKVQERISQRSIKNDVKGSLPLLRKKFINDLPIIYKKQILKDKINSLPTGSQISIQIRRRKAAVFAESGNVDHEGMHTMFG